MLKIKKKQLFIMQVPGTEGFRDEQISEKIARAITKIFNSINRKIKIMHVCGTHENTISKYGIRSILPKELEIVSGPGCPVCVCPAADIDKAIEIGKREDTIITTFGDMLRVPATNISLSELKAQGADVRIVYGPNDAVNIAKANSDKEVIFFAIGFETTVPLIGFEIFSNPPSNFSVICAHKLIPASLELLIGIDNLNIDGFISPGHVATIIGLKPFQLFSDAYKVPNVVLALFMLLKQIKNKEYKTENEYTRVVKPEGNKKAQEIISEVFDSVSSPWRGIGRILDGGLAIKEKYEKFNADKKFDIKITKSVDIPPGCSCHLVMTGKIYPHECKLFKKTCTPVNPIGPCMVSAEGTCSIYYKYGE
jgi:hydrogenase expression/formation protein HypD